MDYEFNFLMKQKTAIHEGKISKINKQVNTIAKSEETEADTKKGAQQNSLKGHAHQGWSPTVGDNQSTGGDVG